MSFKMYSAKIDRYFGGIKNPSLPLSIISIGPPMFVAITGFSRPLPQ